MAKTKQPAGNLSQLAGLRKDLRQFRFQGAGSRAKNVHAGKVLRRQIARILTATNAKA